MSPERPSIPQHSTLRFYGEEFVFDTVSGAFYRMNRTACFILRQLDAGRPVHELPAMLEAQYRLDHASATRDVELLLNSLASLEPLSRLCPNQKARA